MKILLINGGKAFAHSRGETQQYPARGRHGDPRSAPREIRETVIEQGYDSAAEVDKICGPTPSSIRCPAGGWEHPGV
ncbi:hypothetical protein [Salinicola tamaricis]|uniref:hypothetical protein n=1 Tax=Salinicola tamaricis TaxID=1771309 RepID=UPI003BF57679